MNGALDFVCPSANCTWNDFSTLALCSDCQDVTQSTKVEQQNCTEYDMPGASKDQAYLQCERYLFEAPHRGFLVGTVGAQNGTNFDGHKWIPRISSTQLVSNTSAPDQASDDWTKVIIVNLATFQWNSTWDFETASSMMAKTFTTTQCTISWCLKKYMGVAVVSTETIIADYIPYADLFIR
ncbi:hypothetical protein SLS58_004441 [Diplodia intermedia]|uniref:Uncharacterized protein n=1 Tax=Diplodia intermedia TaxID=856260 RepID=A0ABR3TTC6_9PEZI